MQKMWVQSLGWEDSLEEEMALVSFPASLLGHAEGQPGDYDGYSISSKGFLPTV